MRDTIYRVYHNLQKNELCLGVIAWLQQHYITIFIGDLVNLPKNMRNRKHPEKYLAKSREFFFDNKDRVEHIRKMLEDEKSVIAYDAAIRFRTEGRRIKKSEWTLTDQYFVKDIINIADDEVFIDGGAYNGDTIDKLMKKVRNKSSIKKIIAFEPGELNSKLLAKKYGSDEKIIIKRMGLSDKEGISYFRATGSSSACVKEGGKKFQTIQVCSIDGIPECQDATFIKMDIEGAEWNALHGAKCTICRNKPKLTICIYHSDEDMIRLIEYIHELVPEYRLYVRQHTRRNHETVLYAVI